MMHGRIDIRELLLDLLWVVAILTIAAFGAVLVRNVTDMLMAMAYHPPSATVVQRPAR